MKFFNSLLILVFFLAIMRQIPHYFWGSFDEICASFKILWQNITYFLYLWNHSFFYGFFSPPQNLLTFFFFWQKFELFCSCLVKFAFSPQSFYKFLVLFSILWWIVHFQQFSLFQLAFNKICIISIILW